MVWANLKQNFGLLNFILESCVPFAQIGSFIYRKAAAIIISLNNWFEDMEHKFVFETSWLGIQDHLFRNSVSLGSFSLE